MADDTNTAEREAIIRAAVAAMPHTNPLVADDLLGGFTMHTEADDIVAIFQAGRASLAARAGSESVAWPKNAAEVREFFNSDFISAKFAAPDGSPCDEDRYYISAHDFLSAINWWADFPHHPSHPEGMAGWKPIETAPKDEMYRDGPNAYAEYILVWYPGAIAPIRARWWQSDSDKCNFLADGGYAVFPTVWQPLPATPLPASEEKEL